MARDFIPITFTANTTQAGELKQFVLALNDAYHKGKKILGTMNHLNDGSDFSDLEGLFGLTVGKGQTVFNLVNGTIGSMEGIFQVSDAKTLIEKVG